MLRLCPQITRGQLSGYNRETTVNPSVLLNSSTAQLLNPAACLTSKERSRIEKKRIEKGRWARPHSNGPGRVGRTRLLKGAFAQQSLNRIGLTTGGDAGFDFGNCLLDQLDRFFAVAGFVVLRLFERGPRFTQVSERFCHSRLIRSERLQAHRRERHN